MILTTKYGGYLTISHTSVSPDAYKQEFFKRLCDFDRSAKWRKEEKRRKVEKKPRSGKEVNTNTVQ